MYLQTRTQLLKDHLDRLVWCNTVAICMYRYGLLVDISMFFLYYSSVITGAFFKLNKFDRKSISRTLTDNNNPRSEITSSLTYLRFDSV